ncbi:MAG: hypothetical protein U5J98_01330 [Halobacteriales archaeon]|nr:hypothetical protein [Halobacteriales archaeon]
MVFLAFLSYVNTPGVDELLSIELNLVIAAVVALAVAVGRRQLSRPVAAA